MNQKKKNVRLLVILIVLSTITISLYSIEPGQKKLAINQEMFAIEDTAVIDKIVITSDSFANVLEKTPRGWIVNQKFPLDEGLRKVLLSVLNRVRVQRPVSESQAEEVLETLQENNVTVEIYSNGKLLMDYLAGGNRAANLSYFLQTETRQPYLVALPGYDSYVAGIFEISENDWRDRIVFNASPASFTGVSYNYAVDTLEGFTISYDGKFSLDREENVDNDQIFNFLDQLEYILADQYLDAGDTPAIDSISSKMPVWSMTLNKIGSEPVVIDFFNLKPYRGHLVGKINNQQLALFRYERMQSLIVDRRKFLQKN